MNCPFCDEEIKDHALVCKHCGRDLSVLRPVLDRMLAIEARLTAAEDAIHALSGHVDAVKGLAPAASAPAVNAPAALFGVLPAAGAAVLSLLVAHWLIIGLFDLDTLVLRLVSILIPLPFGSRAGKSLGSTLWAAAIVAAVAVFGMLVTTSLIDHVPVLPQGRREWVETVEYIASIGLSYVTGSLFGWWMMSRKSPTKGKSSVIYEIAMLLARNSAPKEETRAHARQRVEAIAGWLNLAALLVTAACSLATGIGKFIG